MLLGQEIGLSPHEIPFNLLNVHLVPDGLRQPYGARVPASQLRLFPQLDPTAKDNRPVTFLMMVKGYPPVKLQGGRQWSLLDFASYAASQLDEPVRRVQLLTTSVPGIQEPQVVVTEGDAGLDLADLRGFGAGVLPTALSPGMTCEDVLQAAQLLDASLQATLSGVSVSDLFLQDAQGQVYEALPAHLLHMQWLVVRRRGDLMLDLLAQPTSTTTTTTTYMQPVPTDHRTVQFIMVGAGATVRLPEVPYNQADPQTALLELLRALVRLGRLGTAFQVQLAPVLPRTSSSSRFVVPFLHTPEQQATAQGQMITVLYDPGVDGSQIHTMVLEDGTRASDILSEAQRRSGAQLYVNGVHSNVCSRPLLNGDLIQQLGGRFQGTARNAGPLLDDISRLRCLTFPMHLPALGLFLAPRGEIVAPLLGSQSLEGVVGDAFEDRLDQLGRPARTSKRLTVFQPGHAPHVLWVPTPLTPSVAEAVALLSDTGLFQDGTTLVEAASDVELWSADAFIAIPSEATWITCTIGDPFAVLYYLLLHVPAGATPPLDYLPLRNGMTFKPLPRIVNGAHIGQTRSTRHAASGSRDGGRPASSASTSRQPDASHGGTSLVQLSIPRAKRRQIIVDDTAESHAAARIVAQQEEAPVVTTRSIPTPFGRREVPDQSQLPQPGLGNSTLRESEPGPASCHSLKQDRQALVLNDLLPCNDSQREAQLCFAVPNDNLRHALASFQLDALCSAKPPASLMHPAAAALLSHLSTRSPDVPVEAAMLFVDGSFEHATSTWAVAVVVYQLGQWTWAGYLADVVPAELTPASAYEGELFGQFVAQGIVAGMEVPAVVFFDNTSASLVATAQTPTCAHTALSRAAASLHFLCHVAGCPPIAQHVKSHSGHPGNELVDSLAKAVLKGRMAPRPRPLSDAHVVSYILQGDFNAIWVHRAHNKGGVWPQFDDHGEAVPVVPWPQQSHFERPADWTLEGQTSSDRTCQLQGKLATYNTLSATSSLQRQYAQARHYFCRLPGM